MPRAIKVIMFTWPSLRARPAPEMKGEPHHHTTGVASKKPNSPIERPKGGTPGKPIVAPSGEKTTNGNKRRAETMNRRSMSATIAAPCPACSACPTAACSMPACSVPPCPMPACSLVPT